MRIQLIRNMFRAFSLTSIIGFSLITSALANSEKPAAVAVSGSYEFGNVFEGPPVIHDFIIKNTGSANLEIQNVKSG